MQCTTEFENENKQLNFLQFQYLLESINKKRKNITLLECNTTYRSGSIQKYLSLGRKNIQRKVSDEYNRELA